jgi:hypothetical protein
MLYVQRFLADQADVKGSLSRKAVSTLNVVINIDGSWHVWTQRVLNIPLASKRD